jgi:L-arabinose transport system substrate-binding protein
MTTRAGVILGLAVAALAAGCSGGPPAGQAGGQGIRIGFLVKMPEEPWFQNEWRFAQQAADRYGFQLIKLGTPDAEKVLAAIDNLAAQGAQGFIICTPDVQLGPAIVAKAAQHRMKVFSVDDQFVGSDGQFMDVHHMGISARAIGRMVGQALWDEMEKRGWKAGETGAIAVTFDELDTARERTDGAIEALTAAGFPKERIFQTPQKTTDVPGAFDAANVCLTQHGDVKHWLAFGLNDEAVLGAVRATEGRGFGADAVIGVGIGGDTGLVDFRKEKPTGFFASVLISPRRHGFETAEFMYKWIKDGVEPPKLTLTSGTLITRQTYEKIMGEQGRLD